MQTKAATAVKGPNDARAPEGLPDAQLTHVGFLVRDLDRMVEFYSRVLGLVVTDRGPNYRGDEAVFMSRNPHEHHQLVLAAGRTEAMPTTLNQVSFQVAGLEELRRFHARLVEQQVDALNCRNHGNAWSIYFHDPEGNRVEVYTPSPWHIAQPCGKPLDLAEPADTIREKTLAMIRDDPSFCSHESWAARLRERIGAA